MEYATGLSGLPRCRGAVLPWRLGDVALRMEVQKGNSKTRRASPSLKGGIQTENLFSKKKQELKAPV